VSLLALYFLGSGFNSGSSAFGLGLHISAILLGSNGLGGFSAFTGSSIFGSSFFTKTGKGGGFLNSRFGWGTIATLKLPAC
jgi:hypothetical protein